MSKRLIGFINNKGGVGKSFGSTGLADVLIRNGIRPLLVDTDGEVGHLMRMFGVRDEAGRLVKPQPEGGVRRFNFHAESRDRVEFASILDTRRELILVDFPAAAITLMKQLDYHFFREAHAADYAVTLVVVISTDEASMASVREAAALDPDADLVVLRNGFFGTDFVYWDGSSRDDVPAAKSKAALMDRRGHDILLPRLDGDTAALVAGKKITFSNAASPTESPLSTGRRSQVATWLERAESEFRKAGPVLGLPANDADNGSLVLDEASA